MPESSDTAKPAAHEGRDPAKPTANALPGEAAQASHLIRFAFMAAFQAAGIWLMLLIGTAVFIAVVTFSATQFQIRLSNIVLNGGQLSIWKAEQLLGVWAGSLESLETARNTLKASQQTWTNLIAARSEAESDLSAAVAHYGVATSNLTQKVDRLDQDIGKRLKKEREPGGPLVPIVLTSEEMDKLKPKYPRIEADLADANKAIDALIQAQDGQNSFIERIKNAEDIQKTHLVELKKAQEEARLSLPETKEKPIPDDQRALIENVIYEFHAMRSFLGGIIYKFSLAPSDTLVLVLVIVMGLLGSSLQLSYVYINEYAEKPISFYLFRPFLGIIVALVVYIVAKAGIPLVTDANRIGGAAPVNPYFISFLAIISGLLSERALEALRQLGASYFKSEDTEPLHWARDGLREQFTALNRKPESLLPILKVKQPELDSWLDGKTSMPPNVQAMIAAVLNKPRRDLFTDLPPVGEE